MLFERIIDEIGRVKEFVAQWDKMSEVSEIERELVLDKLKRLYEEIKYYDLTAGKSVTEVSPAADTEPCWSESCSENNVPAGEDASTAAGGETNDSLLGLIGGKMDAVSCGPDASAAEPAGEDASAAADGETNDSLLELIGEKVDAVSCGPDVSEPKAETAPEPVPATASVSEPKPESESAPQPVPNTIAEQRLFADETPAARQSMNKQIIMSLYGDDCAAPVSHRDSSRRSPEPAPSIDLTGLKTPKKAMGEATGGDMSFNDRIGRRQDAPAEPASGLRTQIVTDLRQAIGIADRSVLIRDLFGGDSRRYEQGITRLNEFTDLDEALIHIQETYTCNPDSDGIRLLVDLLERKLS